MNFARIVWFIIVPFEPGTKEKLWLKGTVSVILSEPPSNDDNAWFTTVPKKPLSDQ